MSIFIGSTKYSLKDWVRTQNQNISTGSRVYVDLDSIISIDTATSFFIRDRKNNLHKQIYTPIKNEDVCIANIDSKSVFIKVEARLIELIANKAMNKSIRVNLMDANAKTSFLNIGHLTTAEIDWVLNLAQQYDEDPYYKLIKQARKYVYREQQANAYPLAFMQSVYNEIEFLTDFCNTHPNPLNTLISEFRNKAYGRQITEDCLKYVDMQHRLSDLVKMFCCMSEQKKIVKRIIEWSKERNLRVIGFEPLVSGQIYIYIKRGRSVFRAYFSTNAHGKSTCGKQYELSNYEIKNLKILNI